MVTPEFVTPQKARYARAGGGALAAEVVKVELTDVAETLAALVEVTVKL
jgi:hypothetical protein